MIKKILLAYDGSEPAAKAFDFAVDLARRYQAELHVLTVAQAPEVADEVETEAIIEHSRVFHKSLLHGLKHRVDQLGVKVHLEMVVGHPAQQILDRAEQQGIDLIVIGHRGRGMFDRWRLGSVTHRVISYAGCMVAVVR
jgi:nucleotide-binding universal stress UspA family protein